MGAGNIFIILVTLLTNDIWMVGLINGLRGLGILFGSMCQVPFIDKVPFHLTLRYFCIANTITTIFSIQCLFEESVQLLLLSQLLIGITISVFSPMVGTIIARSALPIDRADVYSNFVAIGQVSQALGPLIGALVFKFINDKWDKDLCRYMVVIAQIVQVTSTQILLLTSRKHQVNQIELNLINNNDLHINNQNQIDLPRESNSVQNNNNLINNSVTDSDAKYILETINKDQIIVETSPKSSDAKVNFLNFVLVLILVNKLFQTLSLMNTKLIAYQWKDQILMTPFKQQFVTFLAIMTGSIMSSKLSPFIQRNLGESATGVITDIITLVFQIGFLLFYYLKDYTELNIWQVLICSQQIGYRSSKISGIGVWKTIIMDQTAPEHQGKWNIIESTFAAGSSISGIIGGVFCSYIGMIGLNWLCAVFKFSLCIANFQLQLQTKDQQQEKNKIRNKQRQLN